MAKVYDCFTFFNEMDLLEIRLNELDEEVDYFFNFEKENYEKIKVKYLRFIG